MAGINKVILVGNLGRDPEMKHTQAGTAVTRLAIATTRSWTDKTTNLKSEETEWHRVTVWGKLAEISNEHLSKGRQVYIEGRLRTTKYVDANAIERYSTEIVADTVQFLGARPGAPGSAAGTSGGGSKNSTGHAPDGNPYPTGPENDDIPF